MSGFLSDVLELDEGVGDATAAAACPRSACKLVVDSFFGESYELVGPSLREKAQRVTV